MVNRSSHTKDILFSYESVTWVCLETTQTNQPHNTMKLTNYEQQVKEVLESNTNFYFTKGQDEDGTYWNLIDSFGDVDGDPFYDFDDLLDYITNCDEVQQDLERLNLLQVV